MSLYAVRLAPDVWRAFDEGDKLDKLGERAPETLPALFGRHSQIKLKMYAPWGAEMLLESDLSLQEIESRHGECFERGSLCLVVPVKKTVVEPELQPALTT